MDEVRSDIKVKENVLFFIHVLFIWNRYKIYRIFIIHFSFVYQIYKNSDDWLYNTSNTAGEFTALLFGIFDTVDVFWVWKLYSYACGKEVVVVTHYAYCGWNTIFLAFLIMPGISISAQYFLSSFRCWYKRQESCILISVFTLLLQDVQQRLLIIYLSQGITFVLFAFEM